MTSDTEIQNLAAALSGGAIFSVAHTSVLILLLFFSDYLYAIGKFNSWPLLVYIIFGVIVNSILFSKRRKISHKTKSENIKIRKIFKVAALLFLSVLIFYVIAVLFGAPFLSSQEETFVFSVLLTTLVVLPLVINVGLDTAIYILLSANVFDKDLLNSIFSVSIRFTLFGAWLGAVVIPLDWDRLWQAWPIPCSLGALIGYVVSQFFVLSLNLSKTSQAFNQVLIKKSRKYEL